MECYYFDTQNLIPVYFILQLKKSQRKKKNMLTCITCSKQRTEDEAEEGARGTPSTKEAVKSLTAQVLILQPYFLLLQSHLLLLLLLYVYILCSSKCFLVLSLSSFPFLFI